MKRPVGRPGTTKGINGKICGRCKQDLPTTEFNKRDDGVNHYCRNCERERHLAKLSFETLAGRITKHEQAIANITKHLHERGQDL